MRPRFLLPVLIACSALAAAADLTHPRLVWTAKSVAEVRAELGRHPAFDAAFRELQAKADHALAEPMDVPQPKDAAGYTHSRHKLNYEEMYAAGVLYQLTGDAKYAEFVKQMLRRYAELYPTLRNHPAGTSSSPGKIFHQSLNEAVWLVHVSQAYDCTFDAFTAAERARLEKDLFRPMAHFFTVERAHEFDRIHNHGTWAAAGVGMLGYVLGDTDLVEQALRGTQKDGNGGFLRQLAELFSPDGHYCEGPYYGRYALMPFFLFARCVEQNQPERGIFAYRNQLLRSAFYANLQETTSTGAYLPINDALKEKTFRSPEIVGVLADVYARFGHDATLLSVARQQGTIAFSPAGLEVARGLEQTPRPPPFPYASIEFRDGPEGKSGGLGLLRAGERETALLCMKYGVHGMEHGHYDKLSFQFYEQDREILPDYGSARFLNVEQKSGGRYLPENKSWALQTLAHNTVVVDGRSQFDGKYDASEANHSERHFFDATNPTCQVMSAREDHAYPGVTMLRTMALVTDSRLPRPVVIDVFRLRSAVPHTYDYVLNYEGQYLDTNVPLKMHTTERRPLGESAGQQHLWLVGEGDAADAAHFTWMNGSRFYTMTAAGGEPTRLLLTQLGANDPQINLRSETGLILRRRGANATFATIIEPHGEWDGTQEYSRGSTARLQKVQLVAATDEATVVEVSGEGGLQWTLLLNAGPAAPDAEHTLAAGGRTYAWRGNFSFQSR